MKNASIRGLVSWYDYLNYIYIFHRFYPPLQRMKNFHK